MHTEHSEGLQCTVFWVDQTRHQLGITQGPVHGTMVPWPPFNSNCSFCEHVKASINGSLNLASPNTSWCPGTEGQGRGSTRTCQHHPGFSNSCPLALYHLLKKAGDSLDVTRVKAFYLCCKTHLQKAKGVVAHSASSIWMMQPQFFFFSLIYQLRIILVKVYVEGFNFWAMLWIQSGGVLPCQPIRSMQMQSTCGTPIKGMSA